MKLNIREMVFIAIFAALTAVGGFIKIPTPFVPFTLQFLFCAYSGVFLGAKGGCYSQLLYVFIGLLGVPIFANGGGPAYVLQPTFGYLLGFIPCAYVIGKLCGDAGSGLTFFRALAATLLGMFIVYLPGVLYLFLAVNCFMHKAMSLKAAVLVGFVPYASFDVLISIVVAFTAVRVLPIIRKVSCLRRD